MKAQQHLQYKSHSIVWCLFSPRIGIIQRLHFIQSSTSMSVHIEDTTIIAMVRIAQARILVGRKVKSAPKDFASPTSPTCRFWRSATKTKCLKQSATAPACVSCTWLDPMSNQNWKSFFHCSTYFINIWVSAANCLVYASNEPWTNTMQGCTKT